ncbi:MAG TPA: twin-arginine translocase TatA/TatE family subunit [Coriobacteriia bacterium]|nr:twin-arginine translocase TatA/TatE family subunit [Coriobacteriia bacterium]
MFGISGFELLIIVAFVLIIFGPDKLPELARTIGKATRMFKQAQDEMEKMIKVEMLHDKTKDFLGPQNQKLAEEAPVVDDAVDAVGATESAAAAWAVSAEDDEDEEDEE